MEGSHEGHYPAKVWEIMRIREAAVNNKTRYRGMIKHKLWAIARCLWVNFRRILKRMGEVRPIDNNGKETPSFELTLQTIQTVLFTIYLLFG
jgi:hypothetical protein